MNLLTDIGLILNNRSSLKQRILVTFNSSQGEYVVASTKTHPQHEKPSILNVSDYLPR